ncbi:MAG: hypothetical protein LBR60_03870 [Fibrobacter sp.]|jgi:hypothetical protein|nr:hypothetical protein [Fibrobacter sp.]
MTENLVEAKMDIRGFLRFTIKLTKELNINQFHFAKIFIDKTGKRIGIELQKKLEENSYRLLQSHGSNLVYLKGAMTAIGIPVESGTVELSREGKLFVFKGVGKQAKARKTGAWEFFPCRNSSGIPMISLDKRGTLILDKLSISQLDTQANPTVSVEYNPKKKVFTLTFGKKGDINVRTIVSHASVSFMGTLSSNGVALPKESFRTSAVIKGKTLSFGIAKM